MIDHRRGALDVRPPEKVDDGDDRDGLLAKPPAGVGARAFWLARAVACVPPAHWRARFEATPRVLVAAAGATDWAAAVCEGWTRASLLHGDVEWLGALWDFWQGSSEKVAGPGLVVPLLAQILHRLPAPEAAARVEPLFAADARSRLDLGTALGALSVPWPARVGTLWIEALRREMRAMSVRAPALVASMRAAALALPPECFAAALEPIDLPGGAGAWARPLGELWDALRIRRDLFQEILP
jgi:hypothetical protein